MTTSSTSPTTPDDVRSFWDSAPCGVELSNQPAFSTAFFKELTERRYELEPHITKVVQFARWQGADVLEIGPGPGTDAEQFARAGARYTGLDLSAESLKLATARFDLFGLDGTFREGTATDLLFDDQSFDLVYSHGVLHHIPAVERAVDEIHRVLRPGGTALVMVYNRSSLNYRLSISVLRRLGALALLLPHGPEVVSRVTGEPLSVLSRHRDLLRVHGARYLTDLALFLNHNTDGPGNPYSRVYGRHEALRLFGSFSNADTTVRALNMRSYPSWLQRLVPSALDRRVGWHRYVRAIK